jgi:hypothetical protein
MSDDIASSVASTTPDMSMKPMAPAEEPVKRNFLGGVEDAAGRCRPVSITSRAIPSAG